MQDITGWILLGFFIIFAIVYVIKHKRNVNLLTKDENDKRQDELNLANRKEFKNIWIIIACFIGVIVLEKMSILPNFFFSIVLLCVVIYGVFRNIKVYRKANLPIKFIKNELLLGIILCSFFSIFTFLRFFENKQ